MKGACKEEVKHTSSTRKLFFDSGPLSFGGGCIGALFTRGPGLRGISLLS